MCLISSTSSCRIPHFDGEVIPLLNLYCAPMVSVNAQIGHFHIRKNVQNVQTFQSDHRLQYAMSRILGQYICIRPLLGL